MERNKVIGHYDIPREDAGTARVSTRGNVQAAPNVS